MRPRGSRWFQWMGLPLVLAAGCGPTLPESITPLIRQAAAEIQTERRWVPWLSGSPTTVCGAVYTAETPATRCGPVEEGLSARSVCAERTRLLRQLLVESRRRDPGAHYAAAFLALLEPESPSLSRAIEHLEIAAHLVPRSAEIRNDLAVLLLVRGSTEHRSADPARALELLEEARTLTPALPQVEFNRVLALRTLGLRTLAAAAREQLPDPAGNAIRTSSKDLFPLRERAERLLGRWAGQGDPGAAGAALEKARAASAAYAAANRDRLLLDAVSAIEQAVISRDLARVRRLREGHSLFSHLRGARPYSRCEPVSLDRAHAALQQAGSPFASWVRVDQAVCAFFAKEFDAAERLLEPLATQASRDGYRVLESRSRWLLGLVRMRQGRFSEAKHQFGTSRRLFTGLGETGHALYLRSMTAKTLELMSDREAAWSERLPALQGLHRIPDPERRYSVLEEAAEAMEGQGRATLALAFFEEQAAVAEQARRRTGDADSLIFTLLGRQRLLREQRRLDEASVTLDRAEALWHAQSPEDDTRQRQRLDLDIQRDLLEPGSDQKEVFDRALQYFSRSSTLGDQIEVLRLWRARAAQYRQFGGLYQAAESLDQAILETERQRLEIDEPELRARFLAVARGVFEDRISLELGPGGDPWKALSYVERATNRLLLESSLAWAAGRPASAWSDITPEALDGIAAGAVLLVRYGHLKDRLLLWSYTDGKLVLEQRQITAEALRAQVNVCRSAVLEAAEFASTVPACDPLGRLLLPSAARTLPSGVPLLLIPDEMLTGVPFPALPLSPGHRPLIERHPLILAPSLSLLLLSPSSPAPSDDVNAARALFVVDPAFNTRRFPSLRRLPSRVRSAALYSSLYPGSPVITGDQATLDGLLPLLDRYELFQFDGHALTEPGRPDHGGLLLAPSAQPSEGARDVLSASDLPGRPFRKLRRVILAGCSTAPTPYTGTSDWAGLSAAFLARGVPEVITTSWDIRDEPAAAFLASFHLRLLRGEPGYRALQHAAREMLRSRDRLLAAPSSWAGYQFFGRSPLENTGRVRLEE